MAITYLSGERIQGSSTAIVVGAATVWDSSTGIENVTISNSNLTATSDSGSSAWDNYQAQSTVTWNPANLASGEEFQVTFKVTDDSKTGGLAFEKSPSTDIGNFGGVDFGMYMVGNGGTPNYINCMESGTKKAELGDGTGSDAYDVLDSFKMTMDSAGAVKYFRQAGSSGSFVELTGGSRDTASGDYYLYHYSYHGSYGTVITSASPTQIKQDDKTTLTNVPAGTRYEETDTRKIYRCKLTGDPKFDFSNNTGWTQYGTGVSIDTTDEEMDYNPAAASADKRLSYDLGAGNVSDTAWTLRWTFTPTATTSPAGFIMPTLISSNSAYGSGTTVDQIACRFGEQQGGSPAGDFLQLEYTNGASLDSGTGATPCVTASMNTTYYCEMLRNSTTSITLNVRTGSHTGSHATNSPETITNMPSAVGGLRYIMFSNYPPSPSGRSMTSTIDDLEFFNGNNTASGTKVSWVEKGTA